MRNVDDELEQLRAALNARAEDVAEALLGAPSYSSNREKRWGKRGSKSLCCAGSNRGLWFDHELGEGGDLFDLIARERGVPFRTAVSIAKRELLGPQRAIQQKQIVRSPSASDAHSARERFTAAMRIWENSDSISGTLAERYLIVERGLDVRHVPLRHCLRWHVPTRALIGLMRDPLTAKPSGIHRTFLNLDGSKRDRKMLGRQGVVQLTPGDQICSGLAITEGVEDGLAVLLSGWPVWVATSAGAVAAFPIVPAIECLTIFADADEAGRKAADTCRCRWLTQGREACVVMPGRSA